MRDGFLTTKRKVTVAVAFDDRLEALLEAGAALCERTSATLRLVHVCDPWTRVHLVAALESGQEPLVKALQEEAAAVASRRLEMVKGRLALKTPVETAVLAGDLVQALAEDLEDSDTGLLVIGASKGGVAGTSLGFSTAVSMIAEATVPVLVMNEDARLRRGDAPWTLLVADEFSDVSQSALDLGFDLALSLPRTTLVHAHVEPLGERGMTPDRFAELLRGAKDTLVARSAERAGRLEHAGGLYRMEVLTGGVPDELDRTATAACVDLAIFGQHRVFHRKTRHVGLVPFKAMLAQRRPVIVVPQRP